MRNPRPRPITLLTIFTIFTLVTLLTLINIIHATPTSSSSSSSSQPSNHGGNGPHQHSSITSTNLDTERQRQIFNAAKDPDALLDPFVTLDEAQKRDFWSDDTAGSIKSKLNKLKNFDVITYIDVKLVGFNKDGAYKINLPANGFNRFFKALRWINTTHVKNEHLSGAENTPWKHRLATKMRYHYNVQHAPKSLTMKLNSVLEEYLVKKRKYSIPVQAMDDIIAEDYQTSHPLSYTIYVFNLARPAKALDGTRPYTYFEHTPRTGARTSCPTTSWAGGRDQRYLWIDTTAGPVEYGPQTVGEGIVTEFNIPRVRNYIALSTAKGKAKVVLRAKSLVADLATMISHTTNHLLAPGMNHFPLKMGPETERVVVRFFEINDLDAAPASTKRMADAQRKVFDHKLVQDTLASLALQGQDIEFEHRVFPFRDCKMCVQAYAHALKSHTSTVYLSELKTQVHQYLDSKMLHHWLNHLQELFMEDDDDDDDDHHNGVSTVIIPIYLFNLKTNDILLLDRFHQAVAFDDMVVAVQTQAGKTVIDYVCNGRGMSFDTRDATRAILAASLQSIWGILPTHQSFNLANNRSVDNYLWSRSNTPFGPFSQSRQLSFALYDAAARHVLYSHVNSTLTELHSLLGHFSKYNREIDEVLDYEQHVTFIRRWNVFNFKMHKASLHLSLHDFNTTLWYLNSMQHDIHVMHKLIHVAGSGLHSYIQCRQESRLSLSRTILLVASLTFILLLFYFVKVNLGRFLRLVSKPGKKKIS